MTDPVFVTSTSSRSLAALSLPRMGWSGLTKLGFRFACVFFFLVHFPFPIGALPGTETLAKVYGEALDAAGVWVGIEVLGLPGPIATAQTGSSDRTVDYVVVASMAAVAAALALLWTMIDRRRSAYPRLHEALRDWLRYALASAMLGYGLVKVLQSQMPLDATRLLEPFGQASPMGLLWTMMAVSPAYQIACGCAEVLAGFLLLFRRTTTLGALVCVAVMTNVVLLNFSYDVPVKIYSTLLLSTAIFLVLPELGPILKLLLLRRLTEPRRAPRPPFAVSVALAAFACWIVYQSAAHGLEAYRRQGPGAPQSPIAGMYDVVGLVRDGRPVALAADLGRPARLSFDRGLVAIGRPDLSVKTYRVTLDAQRRTVSLARWGAGAMPSATLVYARPEPGHLTLAGILDGNLVEMKLAPAPEQAQLLVQRGFHWVNEHPLSR